MEGSSSAAIGEPARLKVQRDSSTSAAAMTEAQHAFSVYLQCRDMSLGQLAWLLHSAATQTAIADAFAVQTHDPDRIRRASELGFADRGKASVSPRDL